jgi:hypothetical protein
MLERHADAFVGIAKLIGDELKLPIEGGWVLFVS